MSHFLVDLDAWEAAQRKFFDIFILLSQGDIFLAATHHKSLSSAVELPWKANCSPSSLGLGVDPLVWLPIDKVVTSYHSHKVRGPAYLTNQMRECDDDTYADRLAGADETRMSFI